MLDKRKKYKIVRIAFVLFAIWIIMGNTTAVYAKKKNGWSDGKYYKNGVKQTSSWVKDKNGKYYVDASGHKITGWKKIGGTYYFFNEKGKLYNGKKKTGVRLSTLSNDVLTMGIDMSQWQGTVNWNKIKDSGVGFVMLRLGYGKGRYGKKSCTMDDKFQEYVQGATSVGLPIGIYFYSYAKNPKQAYKEAEFVVEHLEGVPVAFPVAYDIEDAAILSATNKKQRTQMAKTFMDVVAAAGYTPMFYCNQTWYDTYLDSQALSDYDFWYARYTYKEPDRSTYPYTMWQATSTQKLSGINENTVDVNFLYKDYFTEVVPRSTALKYGWHNEEGRYSFYHCGEKIMEGWLTIGGESYYLKDGYASTGWQSIDNQSYYFNSEGEMQTGFSKADGKIYLFNSAGVLQTTTDEPGVTIQEDGSCKIKKGWYQDDNGKWFYRLKDGNRAKKQWVTTKGKKYYVNGKGYRVTGLKTIGGKTYYFKENGQMVKNKTITIKGKTYKFNGKGQGKVVG